MILAQGTSKANQTEFEQQFKETEKDADKKLSHSIFMDVIATNPKHQGRQDLDYLDQKCEEIIKDCEVQFLQDHMDKKKNSIVSEDKTHFVFKERYSLKMLNEALEPIIKEVDPGLGILRYFQDQVTENPDRQEYFKQKGLSDDEAFACALALSFYTGCAGYGTHSSYRTNRGASLWARTSNMTAGLSSSKKYFPIMHYMIKALAYIPYYWGKCLRYVDLTSEEQERYKVGSIVSWIQFTSSTAGAGVSYFAGRNTALHIFSLSGRCIQQFSNFHEEEVLFAPWCTFMVTKRERGADGKTHIYVRQVELGTTQNTILWVDDKMMDENWENKALMEILTSQGLERNLRIIPKISTNLALAFADSKFGQYIKKYMMKNDFQIVTDMGRPEEENGSEAGAILIKELRKRGFNHKFTVYCGYEPGARAALDKHTGHLLKGFLDYAVLTQQQEFLEYVSLKATESTETWFGYFKSFFSKY